MQARSTGALRRRASRIGSARPNQEVVTMPSNPKIVEDVLHLLRHYGWETGYKKLEAELQATDDESGRAARELFLGWMAAERGSDDEAVRHFAAVGQMLSLAGWALAG